MVFFIYHTAVKYATGDFLFYVEKRI